MTGARARTGLVVLRLMEASGLRRMARNEPMWLMLSLGRGATSQRYITCALVPRPARAPLDVRDPGDGRRPLVELRHGLIEPEVMHQVSVAEHHPLRIAGRSRRVLKEREVVLADLRVSPGTRRLLLDECLRIQPVETFEATGLLDQATGEPMELGKGQDGLDLGVGADRFQARQRPAQDSELLPLAGP